MSARDGAKAKVKALTSLVWSGEEQREKNWQFEEKKGTWMGGGAKVGVRVQCTTCDTTLTFDGVYDSTTNELTFSRPDDADTWDGVIHFMHSRFLMDGPYIEWKHGQVWTAKNWKRWIRNSALGVAVLAVLMATLRYVRKKGRGRTQKLEQAKSVLELYKTDIIDKQTILENVCSDVQFIQFRNTEFEDCVGIKAKNLEELALIRSSQATALAKAKQKETTCQLEITEIERQINNI